MSWKSEKSNAFPSHQEHNGGQYKRGDLATLPSAELVPTREEGDATLVGTMALQWAIATRDVTRRGTALSALAGEALGAGG